MKRHCKKSFVRWYILRPSLVLFLLVGFSSCQKLKKYLKKETNSEAAEQQKPIARVKDKYLYPSDINSLLQPGMSAEDSTNIVGRYVNNWVRKQLLISEAQANVPFNEAELERKILDYRYALMVYEYEKQYVNKKLDTAVSQKEIQDYYDNNQDNFELKQNIIRGYYVKIAKDAPKLSKLRKLIKTEDAKDMEELRSYCFRFANTYSLEDSVWLNFDEIINNTPFTSITNKVQFLKENKLVEDQDDNFFYFLKIKDYKITDQTSPLEFVAEDIRQIILNKRKVELTHNLEENIYEKAIKDNEFKIF